MPDAHKKNLRFSTYVDPDIPMRLVGDAGKIRQILFNLINNAIKFTKEGEISVNIHNIPNVQEQIAIVRFEIDDTGSGIASQRQENLFERDHPVDINGHKGLGLSISSALVHILGGEIGVDSKLGVGSKFLV